MATYTPNYNLPKYEADDLPNLLDEYNSAMDKIDAQLKTTDNAATQAGTAAGNANTTAQQALSLAQTNESAITSIESDVTSIESEQTLQASSIADHEQRITTVQGTVTELDNKVDQNTAGLATKAPIMHASTASTYGLGTDTNFGHVKLSDSPADSSASAGIAATPMAVKAIIDDYLTPKIVHSGSLSLVKNEVLTGEFTVNVVQYGKIVAISFSAFPSEGGASITSNAAINETYDYTPFTLPENLQPSRSIYLVGEAWGDWTIRVYVRGKNDDNPGKITFSINTSSAIGTPYNPSGNVLFIAAGTGTL